MSRARGVSRTTLGDRLDIGAVDTGVEDEPVDGDALAFSLRVEDGGLMPLVADEETNDLPLAVPDALGGLRG